MTPLVTGPVPKVLAVVPARGGSKGIRGKNLAPLCGRPLLAYTADAVRESVRLAGAGMPSAAREGRAVDARSLVSTDDPAIAEAARALALEVPFLRPADLSADEIPMLPVLQHALQSMRERGFDADVLVLLQPTSPLRRGRHIDAAIDLLLDSGADSVVSVVEVPHQFNPVSVMTMEEGRLRPFLNGPTATSRQQKPEVWARNGPAVLAVRASVVSQGSLYGTDSRPLPMAPEESLDIDTPFDLALTELWLASHPVTNRGPA